MFLTGEGRGDRACEWAEEKDQDEQLERNIQNEKKPAQEQQRREPTRTTQGAAMASGVQFLGSSEPVMSSYTLAPSVNS